MDLPNLDTHYEANSFSFNPLRCAHRVRDRARQVRPVDCGGGCDRDTTVECRGTSASLSYGFAEARRKWVRFQGIVAYVHESEHQIVAHRVGSCFRWSVRGKVV